MVAISLECLTYERKETFILSEFPSATSIFNVSAQSHGRDGNNQSSDRLVIAIGFDAYSMWVICISKRS